MKPSDDNDAAKPSGNEIDRQLSSANETSDNAAASFLSPGDQATFEEALNATGHGAYNYFQLTTCTMIILAATMDMFGTSVTVAAGACDLDISVADAGLLASAPFFGVVSAFPWGYYADTHGRRKALLVSTTVGFTFAALASLAPSWQIMFAFKLIGCLFSTAAFTIAMTYLGECTNARHRSKYLFIVNTADLAAEAIYYALGLFLLPASFSYSIPWLKMTFRSWRLFSLLLAVPMGLGTVMVLSLKESPKFLANNGQSEEALKVLRVMHRWNKGKEREFPVKSLSKVEKHSVTVSFCRSLIEQTVPLFKPPLLWTTLQLFYLIAACCSINNVFLMWYPTMVNQFFNSMKSLESDERTFCDRLVSGADTGHSVNDNSCTISPNTLYAGIALGTIFAIFNLLAAVVAKYRREVLAVSLLVPAVCLVIINQAGCGFSPSLCWLRVFPVVRDISFELCRLVQICAASLQGRRLSFWRQLCDVSFSKVMDPITNLIAFTLVQSTGIGFSCLASYYVDLYPTAYRGMAWSLGVMVGRLASMGGVNVVAAVIVNHCTAAFYCWTVYACSALILAVILPSEMKIANRKD